MLTVIRGIMRKEFIEIGRDRRMLGLLLIAPILQTIIFGYAINLDLTNQPMLIVDLDRTAESRSFGQTMINHDGFAVLGFAENEAEAEKAIMSGTAALALWIPKGFGFAYARGDAEVLLVMDGSDSNSALRAGQEATQLLNQKVLSVQRNQIAQGLAVQGISTDQLLPQIILESRAWFNPQLKTAVFFVPGVLALILMLVTMLLTSMGLTREKEIGTLEQIMVTPVKPWELMIGKTLPFALLGLMDVALIVSAANLIFAVPFRGSVLLLTLATAIFLMTTLGLGLFISTVSASQQQAMLTSFFVLLPALMLSGYVFPIENMPSWVQVITLANPLRYYIDINRRVMIKGAGFFDILPNLLMLASLGVTVLSGAVIRFKKRVS